MFRFQFKSPGRKLYNVIERSESTEELRSLAGTEHIHPEYELQT